MKKARWTVTPQMQNQLTKTAKHNSRKAWKQAKEAQARQEKMEQMDTSKFNKEGLMQHAQALKENNLLIQEAFQQANTWKQVRLHLESQTPQTK